jgi:uncharacterized protein YaaQ
MKLIISVVHKDDAGPLLDALAKSGHRVTTLKSAGGFQRKENVTLFTGVEDERVEEVVCLIQDNCQTRTQQMGTLPPVMQSGALYVLSAEEEVEAGGTVIFVLDVDQFAKA